MRMKGRKVAMGLMKGKVGVNDIEGKVLMTYTIFNV